MPLWPLNQRRPRLRRFGKWLGLVAVMLIVAVDVLSVWWGAVLAVETQGTMNSAARTQHLTLFLEQGQVWGAGSWPIPLRNGVECRFGRNDHPGHVSHWPSILHEWGRIYVHIPLWAPALVLALPTAWLWWRDRSSRRRRLTGRCAGCGYDLKGLEAGSLCPECGRKREDEPRTQ